MRSVASLSLAMSILSAEQCLTISSQACCGMIFNLAWARASAASKSRYFCTRFSSENTARIAGVVKMSRNTAESRRVEGITGLPGNVGGHPSVSCGPINLLHGPGFPSQIIGRQGGPHERQRQATVRFHARAGPSQAGTGTYDALRPGGAYRRRLRSDIPVGRDAVAALPQASARRGRARASAFDRGADDTGDGGD